MSSAFPLNEKIKELETIEAYFQQSEISIDEAIEKHKQAVALAKEILAYLDQAETTIEEVDISSTLK